MYVREILEWIFWILLSVVLLLAGMDVLLATFSVIIAPAPFFILARRQGLRNAILGLAAGAVSVFVLAGQLPALIYLFAYGLLGLIFALLASRAENGVEFVFKAVAASVLLKVCLMVLFVKGTGINPFVLDPEGTKDLLGAVAGSISKADISVSAESVEAYAKTMIETASVLMPAMLILFAFVDTFASYLLTRAVIKRRGGDKVPSLPPFGSWQFPKNIFWALGTALAADLLNRAMPDDRTWLILSMNLREVLRLIFIIEGLALCWYYMSVRRLPKTLKYVITIACAILPPVSSLTAIAGSMDIIFDFRSMMRRK